MAVQVAAVQEPTTQPVELEHQVKVMTEELEIVEAVLLELVVEVRAA
jgi:hypothetical protein